MATISEYICPKCRSIDIEQLCKVYLYHCNNCGCEDEPTKFEHPLSNVARQLNWLFKYYTSGEDIRDILEILERDKRGVGDALSDRRVLV